MSGQGQAPDHQVAPRAVWWTCLTQPLGLLGKAGLLVALLLNGPELVKAIQLVVKPLVRDIHVAVLLRGNQGRIRCVRCVRRGASPQTSFIRSRCSLSCS